MSAGSLMSPASTLGAIVMSDCCGDRSVCGRAVLPPTDVVAALDEARCAACGSGLAWVHGHGACIVSGCQMRGMNQLPCCQP
jgi:hypothetical protein